MKLLDLPAVASRWTLFATLLLLLALPAPGGTAARVELEELVGQCDQALEGRVERVRVLECGPKRIETELTLSVARRFWGQGSGELVVRIPGGVLPDGRGLVLAGLPRFEEGEELILFLSAESRRGTRMPVGLAQGRLRVERRADGTKSIVREASDLELIDPRSGRRSAAPARTRLEYEPTLARIQAAVEARRKRPAGGGAK